MNTLTGMGDFGDDDVSTLSYGGPGKLVNCLKCPACGHSWLPNTKQVLAFYADRSEDRDMSSGYNLYVLLPKGHPWENIPFLNDDTVLQPRFVAEITYQHIVLPHWFNPNTLEGYEAVLGIILHHSVNYDDMIVRMHEMRDVAQAALDMPSADRTLIRESVRVAAHTFEVGIGGAMVHLNPDEYLNLLKRMKAGQIDFDAIQLPND